MTKSWKFIIISLKIYIEKSINRKQSNFAVFFMKKHKKYCVALFLSPSRSDAFVTIKRHWPGETPESVTCKKFSNNIG